MPQEVSRGHGTRPSILVEVSFTKDDLLERILSPFNMNTAYKRVIHNGGSGGVDDLGTEDLLPYLTAHKSELITSLLDGSYRPNPVRRIEIPKDTITASVLSEVLIKLFHQSKLMEILSRRIKDGRVLSLIHKYMRAGVVVNHKFSESDQGGAMCAARSFWVTPFT